MAERVQFYLDEHVPAAVARGLRRRGLDVLTVHDAGLRSADDLTHLEFAMQGNRVLVTQDTDFIRLHKEGSPHAGIVYAPQRTSIGELVRGLCLVADVLTQDDMVGRLEYLP